MYASRWQSDIATHLQEVSFSTGLHQILQRCPAVREWSVWRGDVSWLSLYFTVAVWIGIAPRLPPSQPMLLIHSGAIIT
jgi:hypothetical protein